MRAEVTPAVARAIQSARDWTVKLGATHSRPLHLFLGLLDEPEGRVAELLAQCGTVVEGVRQSLLDARWPISPGAPDLDQILSAARLLAIERTGERTIASEHILAAILQHDADVRSVLESAGVDTAAVEAAAIPATGPPLGLDEPLDLSETVERLDTARILDAAANRAREALRVIDDYARFALNDAFLCREVKTLRHDLAEAIDSAGPLPLLEARDTLADVGTTIATPSESQRDSPRHVVHVNLKRLQEALRSLEEFGKLIRPEFGAALEQMRYRAYTLERAIILGTDARERLRSARLYLLVTGSTAVTSLEFLIAEAAAGGVDIVQLREKNLSDRELLERAHRVRKLTRQAGILFMMNDRSDIARLCEADGVHLGQDDTPVREARRIVGPDALIGVSTHNLDQVRQAIRDGASYIGIGPVFPSQTKSFDAFPGLEFVRQAIAETSLPAFALGGITAENVSDVIAAGAIRVAVSSAICGSNEPRAAARALRRFF